MSGNAAQSSAVDPVPLLDVSRSNKPIRDEVLEALAEVYDSGRFLFGPPVGTLEKEVSTICNTEFAVGCASGSDALLLSLMALGIGPGDEVIVPSFSFFATASCVSRLGAKIVFADIDPRTYNIDPQAIEAKINSKTRAIIPVHLFGQAAEMDQICKIAATREIPVVEDAAQAIGAAYHGRPVGSWGQVGCISFYPTKNLGGFGDGGMLVSGNDILADRLRLLSGHGMRPRYYHSEVGINSRLDTFQAAGLLVKIKHLADYTNARRANASNYKQLLQETGLVQEGCVELPYEDPVAYHVWNQFSLRISGGGRDALREHLQAHGVGSEIYYPIPLHQQVCYQDLDYQEGSLPETEKASREILHLPIFPELTFEEQQSVIRCISNYFEIAQRKAA
ncbi:MAG: DegT/DnrJ/EryC1/StrS family aminotransferase [Planctomycetota bacterium]